METIEHEKRRCQKWRGSVAQKHLQKFKKRINESQNLVGKEADENYRDWLDDFILSVAGDLEECAVEVRAVWLWAQIQDNCERAFVGIIKKPRGARFAVSREMYVNAKQQHNRRELKHTEELCG